MLHLPRRHCEFISSEARLQLSCFWRRLGVPAPKVFDYALEHPDNAVGVGFILMDKLPGKSAAKKKGYESARGIPFVEASKKPHLTLSVLLTAPASLTSAHLLKNLASTLYNPKCGRAGPFPLWKNTTHVHVQSSSS